MTDLLISELTTSTRVLSSEFDYLEPATREEALELLTLHQSVKVLAGGTDLLVKMKTGPLAPCYVLSIQRVADLKYLQWEDGLRVGACTSLATVEAALAKSTRYQAYYEALAAMAGPAIRAMGTVGGNLCNASPAADTSPALLVLGASVEIQRAGGSRTLPLEQLFAGPGKTVLAPGELLTEISLPPQTAHSGSAYMKVGRVSGDIAKVNGAVYLEREGDTCVTCRIALGAVAPTVVRVHKAEALAKGGAMTLGRIRQIAQQSAGEINPITDVRSTAHYRKQMAAVIVEELLTLAWTRAGGESLR